MNLSPNIDANVTNLSKFNCSDVQKDAKSSVTNDLNGMLKYFIVKEIFFEKKKLIKGKIKLY